MQRARHHSSLKSFVSATKIRGMGKKGKSKGKGQATTTTSSARRAARQQRVGRTRTNPVDASAVATRLNSAAIHLLRRLHREDAALGLSSTRLSALSVLVLGGPRTLGQLADAEGVTAPSMTRLVTAMEADGLVERTRSGDGRPPRHRVRDGTRRGAAPPGPRPARRGARGPRSRDLPADDQRMPGGRRRASWRTCCDRPAARDGAGDPRASAVARPRPRATPRRATCASGWACSSAALLTMGVGTPAIGIVARAPRMRRHARRARSAGTCRGWR